MPAQGVNPHWVCNISTDDVDAVTARVREAGGDVINEPFDVFDAGRMSVVAGRMSVVRTRPARPSASGRPEKTSAPG